VSETVDGPLTPDAIFQQVRLDKQKQFPHIVA
jgi:hypothetical protein